LYRGSLSDQAAPDVLFSEAGRKPMSNPSRADVWASGAAYEPYVGRWSRLVAREFLTWLALPASRRWLDVGCGTGALAQTIVEAAMPAQVVGIDPSTGFVAYARDRVANKRSSFEVGDARALPHAWATFDAAVSGLVLNFVPEPATAVAEMARVTRPGGIVAAYVWDYAGEMQLMRRFWEAAALLDPTAQALDEGQRFPLCRPEPLAALFREVGLTAVAVRAIDVPTPFRDFDDYWTPFLGGQGPAPSYCMALDEQQRERLRELLRAGLPAGPDGAIRLLARAWAVRGTP
jgi:SAM-dependent methyltransferase